MEGFSRPGGLAKFRSATREECGIIVSANDGLMTYVVQVPNLAEDSQDFVILNKHLEMVTATLIEGESIFGFVHTHLPHHKSEPTDSDLNGADLHPEYEHLVYKPDTDELCWYGSTLAEVYD